MLDLALGVGFKLGVINSCLAFMQIKHPHNAQTSLGQLRGSKRLQRWLSALLLLMFVANCQALMQGQGVAATGLTSPMTADSAAAMSDMPSDMAEHHADGSHDCCSDDGESIGETCETCLDTNSLQPRYFSWADLPDAQWALLAVSLDLMVVESVAIAIAAPQAPPKFSSYPAIYLSQLSFLE